MSNSTGSSPTTSSSVPHSSHDTISPLSVSKSTWTSASHSGQVPVGTFSSSPAVLGEAGYAPNNRESTTTYKQPSQSTRRRWNLQQSFWPINRTQKLRFVMAKTVVAHTLFHRTDPSWTQGLTGPSGVTKSVFSTDIDRHNPPHVWCRKNIKAALGTVAGFSSGLTANNPVHLSLRQQSRLTNAEPFETWSHCEAH